MIRSILRGMAVGVLTATITAVAASAEAASESCPGEQIDIPGFTSAEIADRPDLKYPRDAEKNFSEGWVLLEYEISDRGEPRNIAVIDAIGPKDFVKVAVDGVARWRYKPATRNGKPVEQFLFQTSVLFRYRTASSAADHPKFVAKYDEARRHIRANKPDEAIAILEPAFQSRLNLYEAAMGSFVLGTAYANKGDWERALFHIGHATIEKEQFIERRMRPYARALEVEANARTGNFHHAVCLFEQLKKSDPGMVAPDSQLGKIMTNITTAMKDPKPLAIQAHLAQHPLIDAPAVWRHRLLRAKFWFAEIKGEVKNFRLACRGTSHAAAIDPEMLWDVPTKAGECFLRVEGAPGATFNLVEEW